MTARASCKARTDGVGCPRIVRRVVVDKDDAAEPLQHGSVVGIESEATARRYDLATALLVLGIAGFLRLYLISHPPAVVFDEVHFGKCV